MLNSHNYCFARLDHNLGLAGGVERPFELLRLCNWNRLVAPPRVCASLLDCLMACISCTRRRSFSYSFSRETNRKTRMSTKMRLSSAGLKRPNLSATKMRRKALQQYQPSSPNYSMIIVDSIERRRKRKELVGAASRTRTPAPTHHVVANPPQACPQKKTHCSRSNWTKTTARKHQHWNELRPQGFRSAKGVGRRRSVPQ